MDVGGGQISVYNATDCPASLWGIAPFYLAPDTCSNITRRTLFGPASWTSFAVNSPGECVGALSDVAPTLNLYSDFNCTSLIVSYANSSSAQNGSCVEAPQEFQGVEFVCSSASSTVAGGTSPTSTGATPTGSSSTTGTATTTGASTTATSPAAGTSGAAAGSRHSGRIPLCLVALIAFVELSVLMVG
jgi:hypothetical protein